MISLYWNFSFQLFIYRLISLLMCPIDGCVFLRWDQGSYNFCQHLSYFSCSIYFISPFAWETLWLPTNSPQHMKITYLFSKPRIINLSNFKSHCMVGKLFHCKQPSFMGISFLLECNHHYACYDGNKTGINFIPNRLIGLEYINVCFKPCFEQWS